MKILLKEYREKQGITQAELSIKSGVSQQAISQIEKNDSATTNTVEKLAKALGVSFFDLLKLDE